MKNSESVQSLAIAVREGHKFVWPAPGAVPFAFCQMGAVIAATVCWTAAFQALPLSVSVPQAAIANLVLVLLNVIAVGIFGLMVSRGIANGAKGLGLALIISGTAAIAASMWSLLSGDQTNAWLALAGATASGAVFYGCRTRAYADFRLYKEVLHRRR